MGALVLALAGCREKAPPPPPAAGAVASAVSAAGDEAPVAPPLPLAEELARYTDLSSCRRAHSERDPVLGDALDALGYEVLLEDACLALGAVKTRSSEGCAALRSSALRARCLRDVAIVAKDVTRCPLFTPGDPTRGRDPLCLAGATGDPLACAGLWTFVERTTCEATALGDGARCELLGGGNDSARCRRQVARLEGLGVRGALRAPPKSVARIVLTPEGADTAPLFGELDGGVGGGEGVGRADPLEALAGAVITGAPGARVLTLGRFRHAGVATTYVAPAQGKVRAALAIALDGPGAPKLRALELELPGRVTYVYEAGAPLGSRFEGGVTVTPIPDRSGAAFTVRLQGGIGVVPNAFRVAITVEGWVRDLVPEGAPVP